MRVGRRLVAIAVAIGSVIGLASPAAASTVSYLAIDRHPAELFYTGQAAEENDVLLTPLAPVAGAVDGILAADTGAATVVNRSPLHCPMAIPEAILCVSVRADLPYLGAGPLESAQLHLGDRDDFVRLDERRGTIRLVVAPGPGDDVVVGGRSDDDVVEGPGDDDVHGGPGSDEVSYTDAAGSVSVSLDDVPDDGVAGEADNIHGDVEDILGSRFADTLIGNASDNWIRSGFLEDPDQDPGAIVGRGGDDHLTGGGGPDHIEGGSGDDVIEGWSGDDVLIGGPGEDVIRADLSANSPGHDTIFVRDGERDVVQCLGGVDTVEADPLDEIADDCENVEIG